MNDVDTVLLGDIATWVTAVGTLGAFYVGFRQIHRERRERKKRTYEEDVAKKKAHAEQLSAWVADAELHLSNSSHHPMHEAVIQLANGHTQELKVVAPGRSVVKISPENAESHVLSVQFTDTHGQRWVKKHAEKLTNADSGKDKAS